MSTARAYSQLVSADQWTRCAHEGTVLLPNGSVELTWTDTQGPRRADADCGARSATARSWGGLAFDGWCRAYRSRPDLGTVDVIPYGATRVDHCEDRRAAF